MGISNFSVKRLTAVHIFNDRFSSQKKGYSKFVIEFVRDHDEMIAAPNRKSKYIRMSARKKFVFY